MLAIIERLYESPLATAIRESENLFPILQTFHILGTIGLAGAIALVDLRLLNVILRREAPVAVAHAVLPITWVGFAIMAVSGGLLFAAQSARIYGNVFLQLKLLLLLIALANVLLFHATTYRSISAWGGDVPPPLPARVFAALSLVLWAGVIVAGRFIAYY